MEYNNQDIHAFRPMLFSIAYNMLGTTTDAEDMVQETYVNWLNTNKSHVENIKFYLIRTISNKCITHLKKLKKERETYKGTWLPEPLLSTSGTESIDIKDNLSIGFMYLLEKLTPIERGVMILKEAFNIDHFEIATIFDITYENCRQHFSRAKKKLMLEKTKFQVDNNEHEKILREFLAACISNNLNGLIELLREDVVVYADGGGNGKAILHPLSGRETILPMLIDGMNKWTPIARMEILTINGLSGAAFIPVSDKSLPSFLIAIDTDEESKIRNIFFMSNPQKLKLSQKQQA
jgi:RNA polymerase sigma-70 factor (ECF subfamily)